MGKKENYKENKFCKVGNAVGDRLFELLDQIELSYKVLTAADGGKKRITFNCPACDHKGCCLYTPDLSNSKQTYWKCWHTYNQCNKKYTYGLVGLVWAVLNVSPQEALAYVENFNKGKSQVKSGPL